MGHADDASREELCDKSDKGWCSSDSVMEEEDPAATEAARGLGPGECGVPLPCPGGDGAHALACGASLPLGPDSGAAGGDPAGGTAGGFAGGDTLPGHATLPQPPAEVGHFVGGVALAGGPAGDAAPPDAWRAAARARRAEADGWPRLRLAEPAGSYIRLSVSVGGAQDMRGVCGRCGAGLSRTCHPRASGQGRPLGLIGAWAWRYRP